MCCFLTGTAAATVLASAAAVAVPPPAPTSKHATVSAAGLFDLARRAEGAGDVAAAEAALRALTHDSDPRLRAEARFRLGHLNARQENWRAAADAWRALLDEQPDAARVRIDLAQALAKLGDEAGARRQLRRANASGLPPDVARLVRRFDAALRSERRIGASAEVALAPDSNINRAVSEDTVDVNGVPFVLDDQAKARSGIGVAVGTQAFARPQLADRVNLLATLATRAELYRASDFNEVELGAGLGPEFLLQTARLRLRGISGWSWYGGEAYSHHFGGEANLLAPLGGRWQLEVDLSARRFGYARNDGLDGPVYAAQLRLEHALSPRFSGRLELTGVRTVARDPAYATWSWTGRALAARDAGPLTIYAEMTVGRTAGDASFLIPAVRRRDTLTGITAGLLLRSLSWRGLMPIARISRTANRSSVFFYDYRRTRVEIGLVREF